MRKAEKWIIGVLMGVTIISTTCTAEELFSDYQNEYEDSYVIYQGETIDIEAEPVITEKGKVTDDAPVWEYAFTAPRDGLYYVEITNVRENAKVYFEYADAWNNRSTFYNNWGTFNSKEGDLYTFYVSQDSGNTDFDFKLIMQQPTFEIAADVTRVNDSNCFSGQLNNYTYEAPVDGVYRFEVNCDMANAKTTTYITSSDGSRINNCYDENAYAQNIGLDKGEKYTISVEQTNGFGPYRVLIGVPQAITDISGYSLVKDKFEYHSQANYYMFTAPIDGIYRWGYETVSGDMFDSICMYNEDWSPKEDFDRNTYTAEDQTVEMEAGKTYYLEVVNPSMVYYVGEYTLHITYPKGMDANLISTADSKETVESQTADEESVSSEEQTETDKRIEELEKQIAEMKKENEMLQQIIEDSGIEISDLDD